MQNLMMKFLLFRERKYKKGVMDSRTNNPDELKSESSASPVSSFDERDNRIKNLESEVCELTSKLEFMEESMRMYWGTIRLLKAELRTLQEAFVERSIAPPPKRREDLERNVGGERSIMSPLIKALGVDPDIFNFDRDATKGGFIIRIKHSMLDSHGHILGGPKPVNIVKIIGVEF